jgi:type I restriction enzyme S subunit
MRLETFFGKFDQLAGAPNAVAKMRDLVLELAVQGRLVEQRDIEGDGHSLLTDIHRIRKPLDAEIEPVTLWEGFPSSWGLAKLGEVAEIIRGVTFPSSAKSETRSGDQVACLRTASVQAEINWSDLIFISSSYVSRPDQWIAPNDILISMANSYALVGKVAIVRSVPQKATFGAFLAAVRPIFIDHYFLLYVLRSPRMQAAFRASASQTTNIANISLGRMRPLPFPLPPLVEQRRIVAKVDELMALCDQLEAQQQEREAHHVVLSRAALSRFAKAPTSANLNFIFHKSYDIEPAELRKVILTLAVQRKLAPQSAPIKWAALGSVLSEASVNGVSKSPTSDTAATEILRISAGTSRSDFYVDECDFKHVSLSAVEVEKFRLSPGDLLACRFNGNLHYVGRFSYYRGESGRVQVNPDKLIRFRLRVESCCPRYVCYAMNSTPSRMAIEAMCATTAGNIGLSASRLKTVEIPLPPLAEQRRIVAKVDQLMALIDQLEEQLATSRKAAARLLDALVAEISATAWHDDPVSLSRGAHASQ